MNESYEFTLKDYRENLLFTRNNYEIEDFNILRKKKMGKEVCNFKT